MKRMKTIAASLLLTLGAFSAITYTACNKDECKSVDCGANGTCISGTCSCTTGYEGSNCQTESRAKFTRNWNVDESPKITNPYTCLIAPGANITAVTIASSFADDFFAHPLTGSVNGNVLTIPEQKPDATGNYKVKGSLTATTSGSVTTLASSYTITNTVTQSTVVVTGTWAQ
jgi:hypothetical protein